MVDLSRQSGVFDQENVSKGKVAVVGGGAIANYICTYMCGLGVGTITLIDTYKGDDDHGFLYSLGNKIDSRKFSLKKAMSKMNEEINIEDKMDMLSNADIIVECTNDPSSKKRYRKIAGELNKECNGKIKKVISLGSDFESSAIGIYIPPRNMSPVERLLAKKKGFSKDESVSKLLGRECYGYFDMPSYEGKEQGSFSSGLIAALCADEVRKVLSPLELDYPLKIGTSFDLSVPERFYNLRKTDRAEGGGVPDLDQLKEKKVLVVGAGGTGTYTALNLALTGFGKIDIYDGDTVEDHNRNRQVLFYGKVDKPKASSLAERLSGINPEAEIRGFDEFIEESTMSRISGEGYDILFSEVDRWTPRKLLNDLAMHNNIPLFDGAVGLDWGRINYYIPGHNKDLNEILKLEERATGEVPRTNHCNPSVLPPNAVVGGVKAAEAVALMFPADYTIAYDKYVHFKGISQDKERLSLKPVEYTRR
ncbi:MAG: ThiF family adenylyltransferase [Candidatus Woesearchaeota archaeon]